MKSTAQRQRLTKRLAHWVHFTLLAGVAFSASILLVGLAMTLITGRHAAFGPPPGWHSLWTHCLSGDPPAILNVGLLVLVATPVLRVLVLAFGWLMERDRWFAAIALAVLGLLLSSAALGVK